MTQMNIFIKMFNIPNIYRMRHVSFARSHTVTSFDNVSLKSANSSKSLERLIDGRKTPEPVFSVESPKIIVLGIF